MLYPLASYICWPNEDESKGRAKMLNPSFVSAKASPSVLISPAHTTNKRVFWHSAKPAFYAAFYAGYEAIGGSTR